jgi:geranylgeranyl pyrophosphate synthase
MITKKTQSIKTTTIRIEQTTKEKIENLDFVRKNTYNEILLKLIEFYNKHKKK